MKICEVLQKEAILADLKARNKKGILEELVAPVAEIAGVQQEDRRRASLPADQRRHPCRAAQGCLAGTVGARPERTSAVRRQEDYGLLSLRRGDARETRQQPGPGSRRRRRAGCRG